MADETYNASDPRQVRDRERRIKHDRKQELADLRSILETAEGRRFLWRLLKHCGLYRTPFNPNASIAAHNAGLQSAAHYLLAEICESSGTMWLQMQSENMD